METSPTLDRWLAAWNNGDIDALMKLFRPDAVFVHPMAPVPLTGAEAFRPLLEGFLGAFSDFDLRAESVLVQGNRVAAEIRHAATNTGTLPLPTGPAPATGRRVSMVAAHFFTLDDSGLITEEKQYSNPLAMLEQLGMAQG